MSPYIIFQTFQNKPFYQVFEEKTFGFEIFEVGYRDVFWAGGSCAVRVIFTVTGHVRVCIQYWIISPSSPVRADTYAGV